MKIVRLARLTEGEYEQLRQAAKRELPFAVNMRYHKQGRDQGSIDITPTKRESHTWTPDQVDVTYQFIQRHKLVNTMHSSIGTSNLAYVYSHGFNYLFRYL